jgi:hypothetical protein
MARFHDLLASLTEEQISALPEGIISTLTEEYDNDLSVRDAAVTERESRITAAQNVIAERDAEAVRLKAANYDLLKATPVPKKDADDDETLDDESDDIDSLFED